MSKTVFFEEIIEISEFEAHFEGCGLSPAEVKELLADVKKTLHTKVLDLILEELPASKHHEFLTAFNEAPHSDSHWDTLHKHSPKIKEKVHKKLSKFKKDLLKDLKG